MKTDFLTILDNIIYLCYITPMSVETSALNRLVQESKGKIKKPDFNGRDFNGVVDLMIDAVGGAEPASMTASEVHPSGNWSSNFFLDRQRIRAISFDRHITDGYDYACIEVLPGWVADEQRDWSELWKRFYEHEPIIIETMTFGEKTDFADPKSGDPVPSVCFRLLPQPDGIEREQSVSFTSYIKSERVRRRLEANSADQEPLSLKRVRRICDEIINSLVKGGTIQPNGVSERFAEVQSYFRFRVHTTLELQVVKDLGYGRYGKYLRYR